MVRRGQPFNYDTDLASLESGLDCSVEPSRTKQSFAEESDINTIVRRFNLTGQLPENVFVPQYGDFSEVTDYHTAMLQVRSADVAFMALPAHVRARFHNNAAELVDFVSDVKNRDEAIKLGLVLVKPEPVVPPPVKVEVVAAAVPPK